MKQDRYIITITCNCELYGTANTLRRFKEAAPQRTLRCFMVIHQTYELWFKQLLFETDSAIRIGSASINEQYSELQTVCSPFKQVVTILKLTIAADRYWKQ